MYTLATIETFNDKARAYGLALAVHLGVALVLLIGLFWVREHPNAPTLAGPVIEAELVGIASAPAPKSRSARAKPAPPKPVEAVKPPEPVPQPPTQPTRNDQIEREKIAEFAQQKAEAAQRAQEERHKQEQILLEKQEQEARDRARELEKIKKELADARKKKDLEKQRLEQMQDVQKQQQKPVKQVAENVPESDKAVTGMAGADTGLVAQYYAAIQKAVTDNWLRPDSTPAGVRCVLRIVQIPGGDVIGVQISNPCNADPQTRTSLEQAVKRAAPLPYKGYEQVFQREFNFNFTYDG